ncbi:MAG TPA: hypothetical protein VM942_03300, partial [Acidimicrobiales bacterium]|nr:hypothetical protein [Acidimicrobiales bacterium]
PEHPNMVAMAAMVLPGGRLAVPARGLNVLGRLVVAVDRRCCGAQVRPDADTVGVGCNRSS